MVWCALALAVLSAVFLALGTHLQSIAVVAGAADGKLTLPIMLGLLRSPRWATGLICLGLGTALNVTALSLAPVSVVQPVGVGSGVSSASALPIAGRAATTII